MIIPIVELKDATPEEEETDLLLRAVLRQIEKDRRKVHYKIKKYLADFKLCPEEESGKAAGKLLQRQFTFLNDIVRKNWQILGQLDFDDIIDQLYGTFIDSVEDEIEALNPKTLPQCISVLFMRLLSKNLYDSKLKVMHANKN